MFEVGKLTDEAMDSFMEELDKVGEEPEGEGEAQRYFHHAVTLRNTVQFLRNNSQLMVTGTHVSGVFGYHGYTFSRQMRRENWDSTCCIARVLLNWTKGH